MDFLGPIISIFLFICFHFFIKYGIFAKTINTIFYTNTIMKPVLCLLSLLSASVMGTNLSDGTEVMVSDCSEAYQQFSFDLYQRFEKQFSPAEDPTNVVISPLSAWFALGMLQQGANTTTLNCINKTLFLPDDFRGLADYNSKLIDDLLQPCLWDECEEEDARPVLELANGFWADDNISCHDRYIDTLGLCYRADFSQLDLALPESMDAVDAWVKEKTHGTIPTLNIEPNVELMMLLVNALYFKAGWDSPAYSTETQIMPFHNSMGEVENVPMMLFDDHLDYAEVVGFKVIRLWFGIDRRFSMTFFVPQDDATFDSAIYTQAKQAFSSEWRVIMRLPRFTTDAEYRLNETLMEMGMEEAFLGADFSGIADGSLFVSVVKQLTHLAVDENGVVASAATAIEIAMGIHPEEIKYITIDHPFYFTIEDNDCDKLMFVGHINTIDEKTLKDSNSLNKVENTSSDMIYDMMGHRQSSLVKGLNIVQQNGKSRLVLVK
jgi:serpin B